MKLLYISKINLWFFNVTQFVGMCWCYYANLLAFPILPICHSVRSKIIECDDQSKTHNGCLIQGECMKVIHYVAKNITQNPFPYFFF
jgi:hypothetical protein